MKRISQLIMFFIFIYGVQPRAESDLPPLILPRPTEQQTENNIATTLSTARYVTGGVVGSLYGFGIGHAIQYRWNERGYIFTAVEAGSAAVAVGALINRSRCQSEDKSCRRTNEDIASAAFFVAVGFHIWEIVDLWNLPPNMEVTFYPVSTQSGLTLIYHF